MNIFEINSLNYLVSKHFGKREMKIKPIFCALSFVLYLLYLQMRKKKRNAQTSENLIMSVCWDTEEHRRIQGHVTVYRINVSNAVRKWCDFDGTTVKMYNRKIIGWFPLYWDDDDDDDDLFLLTCDPHRHPSDDVIIECEPLNKVQFGPLFTNQSNIFKHSFYAYTPIFYSTTDNFFFLLTFPKTKVKQVKSSMWFFFSFDLLCLSVQLHANVIVAESTHFESCKFLYDWVVVENDINFS